MKLEKYLENFKKSLKTRLFEIYVELGLAILFAILGALAKDLSLENLLVMSGGFLLFSFIVLFVDVSMLIVYVILLKVKEKNDKKLEIEKIIEEELGK